MSSKDAFALGVRLFGVCLFTLGVAYVAGFVEAKLYPVSDMARDRAAANLIYAAFYFASAAFLLLWTHVIVAWTYGGEREVAKDEEEAPEVERESSEL